MKIKEELLDSYIICSELSPKPIFLRFINKEDYYIYYNYIPHVFDMEIDWVNFNTPKEEVNGIKELNSILPIKDNYDTLDSE